jgi:Holliday junction DNA helicase RuvA
MIAQLKGIVTKKEARSVIVNVGGVGYRVFVSDDTLHSLPGEASADPAVELWTYLAVRENALDLYGFATESEQIFFEHLIGISGIGPKSALSILNAASISTLEAAVATANPALLSNIPGVGKKNAAKIVLELKGKIVASEETSQTNVHMRSENDAADALKSLGYTEKEARHVLSSLPKDITDATEKVKRALKILGGGQGAE